MLKGARRVLLALFVLSFLSAGYVLWDTYASVSAGLVLERDVHSRLDRLSEAIAALGAAQQAYVAPGQQRGEALTQASVLVQELYDQLPALRRIAHSPDAPASLLAVGEAVDSLVQVDDRVRDHLRADQELMAADLVYTEARQTLEAMTKRVTGLREAEDRVTGGERRDTLMRAGRILGSIVLLWTAIVFALARLAAAAAASATTTAEATPHGRSAIELLEAPLVTDRAGSGGGRPEAAPQVTDAAPAHAVSLEAAAGVCAELAQVTNGATLTRALGHAAHVLDAPGLIVWLGAGEELFAATAYGYAGPALARLGAIPRNADNVTAAVWRTGTAAVVPGDATTNGAIVAPLAGAGGCFGVLSVEVKDGLETNAAARAIIAMIAAQLSAVVAPGPAASQREAASA